MEDKKFYIINYKETTVDGMTMLGITNVDCGTFDYGFEDFSEACKSLVDVAQKRVDEIDEDIEVDESWNDERSYVCINAGDNSYEYYVSEVTIPSK